MEFWSALGRLYDSTVALKDATEALCQVAEAHEFLAAAGQFRGSTMKSPAFQC